MLKHRRDARALDHQTLEALRIRGVEAVQEGGHPEDVARTLGVSRACMFSWLAQYRSGGWGALKAKPVPGRPRKMSGERMEWLYRKIAGRTPEQYRFEYALWTLDLIRWLIYEEWKIRLSKASVWRLLKHMGLSAQRPMFRASEQDARLVREWREKEFPRLQQLAQEQGAEIWFEDEGGIRSDYHGGTTWAPVGRTPVVRSTGARYRYNMLSAINNKGELRFMLTTRGVNTAVFIEFLRRLIRYAKRPIFLIVDGHPTHRSSEALRYVESTQGRLRLFFLPPYSPELNPDEMVWNEVKRNKVGRQVITGKGQMKQVILAALRALQRLPEKIRSFFQLPDTAYAAS
jgi:transposase